MGKVMQYEGLREILEILRHKCTYDEKLHNVEEILIYCLDEIKDLNGDIPHDNRCECRDVGVIT